MSTETQACVDQYLYDEKHRKIISKDSLIVRDSTSETEQTVSTPQDDSWTQHSWRKAGAAPAAPVPSRRRKGKNAWGNQPTVQRPNVMQKNLEKALAKPVQMTKAQSMMQKMGWEGGALGKSGTGIVEPVAPNAAYAIKTRGFGQATHTPEPPPPPPKKKKITTPRKLRKHNKKGLETFHSNALHIILEFVKNDYESEMVFDKQLSKNERKHIHHLVNLVINENNVGLLGSIDLMDIVEEIRARNCYVLCTESQGTFPDRYLCLFKEAPEHVYLITPKDLREQSEDDDELDVKNEENVSNNQNNEIQDYVNHELKDTENPKELVNETPNLDKTADSSHSLIEERERIDKSENELNDTSSISGLVKLNANLHNIENKELNDTNTSVSNTPTKDIIIVDKSENKDNSNKSVNKSLILDKNVNTKSKYTNILNNFVKATANVDENFKEELKNSYDINIKENKESECNQKVYTTGKLIEFLKEFTESEDYSEIRFLGPFTSEEMDCIDNLVSSVYYHVNRNEDKVDTFYKEVFSELDEDLYILEVKEDINGSPVIHKTYRH